MLNIKDLTLSASEQARKLGITKYDIYGISSDETTVKVVDGAPGQITANQRNGFTVRVWGPKNTVGVASTTETDPAGLARALSLALDAAEFGELEHAPDFSPEATAPLDMTQAAKDLSADNVSIQVLLRRLLDAESQVKAGHVAIQSVPYNSMSQRRTERFYLNSAGAARAEARSTASVFLYTRAEEEGRRARSAGQHDIAASFKALDVNNAVEKTVAKTISHLDYKKVESGKYLTVFSPRAFLDLLATFSNLFDAQRILDGQSLATLDTLNTTVAAPSLTVWDDPLHPGNITRVTFDGEGTPTRKVTLIEQGTLRAFLHSAGTAKRTGTVPTGNSLLGSKVTVSPHYLHVASAPASVPKRAWSNETKLVYVDELNALHAGASPMQGSFSLPFDGWLIENGTRTSIESATVAGDFLTVLKSIIHVDHDTEITPDGVSPSVWVGLLSITGDNA